MAMVRTYALHLFLVLPGLVAGLVLPVPSNIITACPSYRCGHTVDIRYPFWVDNGGNGPHCGYRNLRLECRRDIPVLQLPSGEYGVTRILYGNKIDGDRTVSLIDLVVFSKANTCPLVAGRNLTLPSGSPPPLVLTDSNTNLTFFTNCSFEEIPSRSQLVECMEQGGDGRHHTYVFQDNKPRMPYAYTRLCDDVVGMPVLRSSLLNRTGRLDDFVPALNKGFELRWLRSPVGEECHGCENSLSGGQLCGQRRRGPDEAWNFTCLMISPASLADGSAPTFSFIRVMLFFYSFLLICLYEP